VSIEQYNSCFFKDQRIPYIEARLSINSDYRYREHFHDTLSIGAIEEGKVSYIHENQEYFLEPGKLAIINPKIVHKCNPENNQTRTYHMIYIDPIWCKKVQESIFGKLNHYLPINEVEVSNKELFEDFIQLNYLLLNKSILLMEKEEKLYSFFYKLFNNLNFKESKILDQQDYPIDIIEKAKLYIQKNIKENLTIQEISEYLKLSEYYFIRYFKKETCMTPHAFLLNEKITFAKKLLEQNTKIVDVALEAGFYDQSHFNKVFKQFVAATPYEYQTHIGKNKE